MERQEEVEMSSRSKASITPKEDEAFQRFALCLQKGEPDAAVLLLSRYSAKLLSLARANLNQRLLTKGDEEDVLQSVFRTFFRRLNEREIELRDWQSLWGLLTLFTLRKCQNQARRFHTARRNVRLEVSLHDGDAQSIRLEIPNRDPDADEVVAFTEILNSFLNRLEPRERQIFERLIAGESIEKLALEAQRSKRAVQRLIARLRQQLLASLDS